MVRNPVTYPPLTVEGLGHPCACDCGREVFTGEFVRGHEQTALHQRVAQVGTIAEFLRWFDAVRGEAAPVVGAPSALLADARHLLDLWAMLPSFDDKSFWSALDKAAWGNQEYFMEKMQAVPHMLRQYLKDSGRSLYTAQYLAQYVLMFFDGDKEPAVYELLDKAAAYKGAEPRSTAQLCVIVFWTNDRFGVFEA